MTKKEPLALTYVPGMNIALCRDPDVAGSLWVWHYMYHSEIVDRTTPCPRSDVFLELVIPRHLRAAAEVTLMALTTEQRQRLVDNLTTLRRQRLRDEGKTPPLTIDAATSSQLMRDSIIFGFSAFTLTWQQRKLTPAEREWELFPRPGKLWMPTLQRRDPLDVTLKK